MFLQKGKCCHDSNQKHCLIRVLLSLIAKQIMMVDASPFCNPLPSSVVEITRWNSRLGHTLRIVKDRLSTHKSRWAHDRSRQSSMAHYHISLTDTVHHSRSSRCTLPHSTASVALFIYHLSRFMNYSLSAEYWPSSLAMLYGYNFRVERNCWQFACCRDLDYLLFSFLF